MPMWAMAARGAVVEVIHPQSFIDSGSQFQL